MKRVTVPRRNTPANPAAGLVTATLAAATQRETSARSTALSGTGRPADRRVAAAGRKSTAFSVRATIAVGSQPVDVVVSADGKRVYVANNGDNTISVIDTTTNTTIDTPITVGSNPWDVAISPDGTRLYVSTFEFTGSGMKQVHYPDNSLGELPYDQYTNVLVVIDTATNTAVRPPIEVSTGLSSTLFSGRIAVSPDGNEVFVTARDFFYFSYQEMFDGDVSLGDQLYEAGKATLVAIDPESGDVFRGYFGGGDFPTDVAFSPDGGRRYTTAYYGHGKAAPGTAEIRYTTQYFDAAIGVGTRPWAIAVSPDGSRVYVTNRSDGTVSVVDPGPRMHHTSAWGTNEPDTQNDEAEVNFEFLSNLVGALPIMNTALHGVGFVINLAEFDTAVRRGDGADMIDEAADMIGSLIGTVPVVGGVLRLFVALFLLAPGVDWLITTRYE